MNGLLNLRAIVLAVFLLACTADAVAQVPTMGAQVWIEPGQTPKEIDLWFAQLEQARMPVARVFLMWSYLEPKRERWDFTLYDCAFRSAQKHHIRVVATLTPAGPPPFLGGDGTQGTGLVRTAKLEDAAKDYVLQVVRHYRSSPALDSWILFNEPGQSPTLSPIALNQFRIWLPRNYPSISVMNRAWGTSFSDFGQAVPVDNAWNHRSSLDWIRFWSSFQTRQLRALADFVRAEDPNHGIHLNPHALLSNLAGLSDDLPEWRGFLDSLGCSIHPAWHFGLLNQDQYALGVSFINDLIDGSIAPKPHWVTELQGGNNISSGIKPIDPTPEQISQWSWISFGAGAKRVIFWLLNARREGPEAAEWSLLDFEQRPSPRLAAASGVARTIDNNATIFAAAAADRPPITLILSPETMTFEDVFAKMDDPGRDRNAQTLETLGLYQALSRLGSPPAIRHIDDYEWEKTNGGPRIAILPDVRVLTVTQTSRLTQFVANGNTLLITGLTGFYDSSGKAWPLAGFPLSKVTGGRLKETTFVGTLFPEKFDRPTGDLVSHLWESSIDPAGAEGIGTRNGEITATDWRPVGGGRVIWIPSLIGLGSWLTHPDELAEFTSKLFPEVYASQPFRFDGVQHRCLLRVLRSGNAFITIVANGSGEATSCTLLHAPETRPEILWGAPPIPEGTIAKITLEPQQTSVLLWK
jgi:beta-galactosidase